MREEYLRKREMKKADVEARKNSFMMRERKRREEAQSTSRDRVSEGVCLGSRDPGRVDCVPAASR